jgi:NAD-dependent dihydropyrimidine dehydrogenase PreA subunit
VGEPCGHTSEVDRWNCLQFGRSAEYVEGRDSGKQLTLEEALELCDTIEDEGLLHMWPNTSSMLGVATSCQCCRDCCMNYVPMDMIGESMEAVWAKSRFEATVDQDKCIGCQDCVDRCMFDAIEMIRPASGTGKKSKKMKAVVDPEKCWGCGVCVVGCDKVNALAMKVVRPPEHIPDPPSRN